jgi:hypothetical protein
VSAQPIEITDGACVEYKLLAEPSDPHRVRFWLVSIDVDGLTLQADHEPDRELTREVVEWHELHDMMTVRPALLGEIEELRQEVSDLTHECSRLRTHWHRLKRIVNARQVTVGDAKVFDLSAHLAARVR